MIGNPLKRMEEISNLIEKVLEQLQTKLEEAGASQDVYHSYLNTPDKFAEIFHHSHSLPTPSIDDLSSDEPRRKISSDCSPELSKRKISEEGIELNGIGAMDRDKDLEYF